LTIELDQHYVGVQLVVVHSFRREEIVAATRGPDTISFETRGTNQRQIKPRELGSSSITPLLDFLDVFGRLFLVAFEFFSGLMDSVRRITKLLYALIDLLKLYLRRICRRDDLRDCLFHGFALADETLERVVAFLGDVTPVSVRFTIEVFIFVDEIHS